MDKKAPVPLIRDVEAVCDVDGCGSRARATTEANDHYAFDWRQEPAQQKFSTLIASAPSRSENLKVHEELGGSDESAPWGLHETGVFMPWTPGRYPRIKSLCADGCCTHHFLEPLGGTGLEGVGCETTKLWVGGHEVCTAKATTIRVGKKHPRMQGTRLIDLALRMGYLLAHDKGAKVAALVKRIRGKILIFTPNLEMCTRKLRYLLGSLQARALTELVDGKGPKFSLPTSVEHDMVRIAGVEGHTKCIHPDSASDAQPCICVPKGKLKPKRVVISASRHDTTEDYGNYGAVSYTWQECGPEKVHQLLEDQELKNLSFSYCGYDSSSGHEFCLQRKLDGVWIDQQCINQQDPKEKADEIGNMRSYYENAEVVFVMLPSMVLPDLLVGFTDSCILDLHSAELGMETLSDQWDKQLWRTRVWTYQEGTANVNTIAVCSNGHLQLSTLEAMVLAWRTGVQYFKGSLWEPDCLPFLGNSASLLWTSDFERSSVTREMLMMEGRGGPGLYGRPLRDIVPALRNRDCSLVLDRVYGVLGLACDGDRVRVDYSMTEEELMLHLGTEGLLSIDTLRATSISDTLGYSWMPKGIKGLPRSPMRTGTNPITLRMNEDGECKFLAYEESLVLKNNGRTCVEGCIWYGRESEHDEEDRGWCKIEGLQCVGVFQNDVMNGEAVYRMLEIYGHFIVPGRKTAWQTWQRTGPAVWVGSGMSDELERFERLMSTGYWTIR